MKYMRTIQVIISTVNALSFRTDHLDKQCKLRSALLLRNHSELGLHSCHSVWPLLLNCNNSPIIVGQGSAELAAGAGWKLFDFWGAFFNFNGFLPRTETVKFYFFCIFL